VADTRDLQRRVTTWAATVQDKAASSMVRRVSAGTPKVTGKLEQARRRTDSRTATRYSSLIQQPGGTGEPDLLPNWIDENTQFEIRPRRARFLVFPKVAGLGSASFPRGFVFAKRVVWKPKPRGVGFWSKVMNQTEWQRSLDEAAASTTLPS